MLCLLSLNTVFFLDKRHLSWVTLYGIGAHSFQIHTAGSCMDLHNGCMLTDAVLAHPGLRRVFLQPLCGQTLVRLCQDCLHG